MTTTAYDETGLRKVTDMEIEGPNWGVLYHRLIGRDGEVLADTRRGDTIRMTTDPQGRLAYEVVTR